MMAGSGDSAIEIIELSQDPDPIVTEADIPEGEPFEEDVFLSSTPVSKFAKMPVRPKGIPIGMDSTCDNSSNNSNMSPYADCERRRESKPKVVFLSGHRAFLFILALLALSLMGGFFAGYFVREKVFERERLLRVSSQRAPGEVRSERHQQAVGNVSEDSITDYASMLDPARCSIGEQCGANMVSMVAQQLQSMGFTSVTTPSYNILASVPDLSHTSTLQTVSPGGQVMHVEVLYGAKGEEDRSGTEREVGRGRRQDGSGEGREEGDSRLQDAAPSVMYMPYSASGQVEGELVYVHQASKRDLLKLSRNDIKVAGKIAIARQGIKMVTDQVKNVQESGMIGLILYADPADMDTVMATGVDRLVGMTGMMGDPLTPGCPAMEGIDRRSMSDAGLPMIPVQPISPQLAASLLGNITGRKAPLKWQGGLDVVYNMGKKNTKKSGWTVQLNVSNNLEQQMVQDVVVTITGTKMPDEFIIIGSHLPAMMSLLPAGMPQSPGQGSASMFMETARVISQMMNDGWRPKRTVVMGMWGGAEYGHAGSTEWAEEHKAVLGDRGVVYIDLDTMMGGGGEEEVGVTVEMSPLLKGVVMNAAHTLKLSNVKMMNLLIGSGEHVAFSGMLGIPSVRLHATADGMMSVTKLATQMVFTLADADMMQFDLPNMADVLVGYFETFESTMGDTLALSNITMTNLKGAITDFMDAVKDMQSMMDNPKLMESSVTMTMVNNRLMYCERPFVDVDSTGSMIHVLYGTTEVDTFPLIADFSPDSMDAATIATMMQRISFIQCSIQSATLSLRMMGTS